MRWLVTLILCSVICVTNIAAQEATATAESKPIIERCIEAASEPSPDWRFDGTIITYKRGDGIYGFRADFPSRYYIAFDNDTEYGRFGSFSPDGHWFASYLGREEYEYSWFFNSSFYVTAIRIVSTLPDGKSYRVPVDLYQYNQLAHFSPVMWLDNAHFVVPPDSCHYEWHYVSPFDGAVRVATEAEATQLQDLYSSSTFFPMDNQQIYEANEKNPAHESARAFFSEKIVDGKASVLINDFANHQIIDTCVETDSFVVSPSGEQVAVSIGGDKGFIYILDLKDCALYRLNLAANRLVTWIAD